MTDKWLKTWYLYIMEFCEAMKDEILQFSVTWLEDKSEGEVQVPIDLIYLWGLETKQGSEQYQMVTNSWAWIIEMELSSQRVTGEREWSELEVI